MAAAPLIRAVLFLLLAVAILPVRAQQKTEAQLPGDETLTEIRILERVTAALDRSMEYLAGKQRPDGGWDDNNAANGLALLAFMGRGHVPGRGPYKDVLEKGKRYLLSTLDPQTGYFKNGTMYQHGLSTLALAEMYGMDYDPKLEEGLRKAVDLIVRAQSPSGGWRYSPQPGDQDLSVTIMQVVALRAANNAEIPVPTQTIAKAASYVRSCASAGGGFGYSSGAGASPQVSAAGVLAMQLLGQYNDALIPPALEYLSKIPIQWGGGGVGYFFYFHYYAIQSHYQFGGKYWNNWHPQVRELFLSKQNSDGSWDLPPGDSGAESVGPGIYSTAMASLVLEIYMHFLPAYQR